MYLDFDKENYCNGLTNCCVLVMCFPRNENITEMYIPELNAEK